MIEHVVQQLGNYRLVRHLGRGGFADVYLGIHIHLKTPAAIKVLHTKLTDGEFEKFRTEARTIARLEHPHIVRVLDFGIDGNTPFLVMSYAPNGTLRQHHPKGERLPLATVVSYVRQIADALYFAHQQKLIHRDIKPENMLLGRKGEILLSDFGFVLIAQSSLSQSTKEMAGTLPYMAPEQLQGRPRPASDQYALGIVVYEWLSGDRPFSGSALEIATQHILQPPPPLRTQHPDLPSEVEEVIFAALAKDPQQRFATVRAFANALEQASALAVRDSVVSTSTVPLEFSQLPSIDTVPLAAISPDELHRDTSSSQWTRTIEPTIASLPVPHDHTELPPPVAHTLPHRIRRRALLTGLVGVALGGAVSSGFWLAKFAGPVEGNVAPPPVLASPGTAFYIFSGHTGTIFKAAWSPDGFRIASASADKTVKVWDAVTGTKLQTYKGHADWVLALAWSPDGKFIASGGANGASTATASDKTVQVWEAATLKLLYTFREHQDSIRSLAWSPDGSRIASASYDNTVKVWDAFTGLNLLTYTEHSAWIQAVAWSPDGTYIASGGQDYSVRIWDAATGKNRVPPIVHGDWVESLAWSPDSAYVATADGDNGSNGHGEHLVRIIDARSGQTKYSYRGHKDEVSSVAWSPDGKRIASGTAKSEHAVQVWEALTGKHVLTYDNHQDTIWSVAWSPDGSLIASGSKDKTVQVWKAV